jgi:hypothetical protein
LRQGQAILAGAPGLSAASLDRGPAPSRVRLDLHAERSMLAPAEGGPSGTGTATGRCHVVVSLGTMFVSCTQTSPVGSGSVATCRYVSTPSSESVCVGPALAVHPQPEPAHEVGVGHDDPSAPPTGTSRSASLAQERRVTLGTMPRCTFWRSWANA